MSEWWTYTLSDLLLFSPRVYYRLLELHNRDLWPLHLVTSGLGAVVGWRLWRPTQRGDRIVFGTLGVLWVWVGWVFFWERYATINWAAVYVAPLFVLQGVLLVWLGAAQTYLRISAGQDPRRQVALALFALALVGYPVLAPLLGRTWWAAESFALMPDPTAVATLAVLAGATGRVLWPLLVVPMAWCAVAGATLWAMEAGDFLVAPLAAVAAAALSIRRRPAVARCGSSAA